MRGAARSPPNEKETQGRRTRHTRRAHAHARGEGKRGAPIAAGMAEGRVVNARGYQLKRGAIDMMMVEDLAPAPDDSLSRTGAAPTQKLGRWRVVGEICDGKCYVGAMRPGAGSANKACANLCIM